MQRSSLIQAKYFEKEYFSFMAYSPRKRTQKHGYDEYTKPLRRKKENRRRTTRIGKPERQSALGAQEASEITLKRLHTLGAQKFGSSPFREHFDRWLTNLTTVLDEFESNSNIGVDDQFLRERSRTLQVVTEQLAQRRKNEESAEGEMRNLINCRALLEQFKIDYVAGSRDLRKRRNSEVKRLCANIKQLSKDQEEVVRSRPGLLRGILGNKREEKEEILAQKLASEQRELELSLLKYKTEQGKLRDKYEAKSLPIVEQLKSSSKKVDASETDGSLEDRWFACQVLIDSVNTFLQRKALQKQ